MTILEKFKTYAEGLPPERRYEVEEILASIMESDAAKVDLTTEELAEVKRRLGDPNPEYADPAEIDALLASDDD
jgi:hypothetical protein